MSLTLTVLEVNGVAEVPVATALAVLAAGVVDAAQTRARDDVTAETIAHVDVVVALTGLAASARRSRAAPVARRTPVNNTVMSSPYTTSACSGVHMGLKH